MVLSHRERVHPSTWSVCTPVRGLWRRRLPFALGPGRVLHVVQVERCVAPPAALPFPQRRSCRCTAWLGGSSGWSRSRPSGALAGGGLQAGRHGAHTTPTWKTEEGLQGLQRGWGTLATTFSAVCTSIPGCEVIGPSSGPDLSLEDRVGGSSTGGFPRSEEGERW